MLGVIVKNYSWAQRILLTKNLSHIQAISFGNANSNKLSLYRPPRVVKSPHTNQLQVLNKNENHGNFIDFQTFFSSPALQESDIKAFDVLYKTRRSIQVRGKSKKTISTSYYKHDVYEILVLKLSNDYDKILYFLRIRGQNIKDVEILYVLEAFSQYKLIQKFYEDEPLLYAGLFKQAEVIHYSSVDVALRMLDVLEREDLFYPEVIKQVYKNYLMRLNEQDSSYNPDDVIRGLEFLKLREIYELLETEIILEALTTKFFSERCLFPKVFEYLCVMNDIGQVAHEKFQLMLQDYLVECIPFISIQDFIEVFYVLVKNGISESVIYYHVEDLLRRKFKGLAQSPEEISEKIIHFEQFGKLVWAISQIPSITENEKLWDKIEDITLTFVEKQLEDNAHLQKRDISIILQSFNKADRGSNMFWSFRFEDIVLRNTRACPYKYSDLIILFFNRIKRQIYYPELFGSILEMKKELQMNYLSSHQISQFHLTMYVYSVGLDLYSEYLKTLTDADSITDKQETKSSFLLIAQGKISDYCLA